MFFIMPTEKICYILNNSGYILNSFNTGRRISSLARQFDCDSLIIEAVIRSAMKIADCSHDILYTAKDIGREQ
jgi:hypothetical protein